MAVSVLGVGVLSGACSSPSATPSPTAVQPPASIAPTGSGACGALTTAEIETAIGASVSAGASSVDASVCEWSGAPTTVSLTFLETGAGTCVATRPEGAVDISGLGDDAWWEFVQAEVGVGTLVSCPNVSLTITGTADEPSLRVAAEMLAATAIQRVPTS